MAENGFAYCADCGIVTPCTMRFVPLVSTSDRTDVETEK